MSTLFKYFRVAFITLFVTFATTSTAETLSKENSNIKQKVMVIKSNTIIVNGKSANIYRIEQADGTWGYYGVKGEDFDVIVKNKIDQPTAIHWHGLVLPNDQDGVPYITQSPIPPGGEHHYHYKLIQSGTYWMHSHFDFQIQKLLSAPFIISDPSELTTDQQVIMFLTDFSFKNPETIFKELHSGSAHTTQTKMNMHAGHTGMHDLVDVKYDAFLTNYRTLSNPDIIKVDAGKSIRLRLIDGSSATNFFIDLGKLKGKLIAADGNAISPIVSSKFQLAVGQRLDILITIPKGKGVYPILAQGEGTKMQTGLMLATSNSNLFKLNEKNKNVAGALDYAQEFKLNARYPLPRKSIDRTLTLTLEGNMIDYIWTINKQAWPNITPIKVSSGKRIELVLENKSDMSHPMHLHGHVFEVTEIDGKPLNNGAMRDTILVLPHSIVKVQFDTDNPGNWMLHCHMLYHQESGMMTLMSYDGIKLPDYKRHSPHIDLINRS